MSVKNTLSQDLVSLNTYGLNYQVEMKTAFCYLASFIMLLLLQAHLGGYQKFEELLSYVKSSWDGELMITGDFNLDLLCTSKPQVLQYCHILEQSNLTQILNKPARTTLNRASLIDHIILSDPTICKHTDVLPCPHISDHDGPYAILNVRVPRFQPRLKYIRDEKHLNIEQYVSDINDLPFSLIYAFDDV